MPKRRNISIGVGVLVIREGRFLYTRRRKGSSWGAGALAMPGGHIEEFEPVVGCAVREVREETGLIVEPRGLGHTHVFHAEEWFRQGRHHWTVYVAADIVGGRLENPEPDKHEDWRWGTVDELAAVCGHRDWIPVGALRAWRENLGLS